MPSPDRPPEPGWSVLLPTYQAAPYLRGCFDALWAQDFVGEVEVLVADGGSTDGTVDLVEAEIARGRPVRLFDNPERLQAAGLNVALRHARHDLVVRCDAQSRLPRNALRLLAAEHRRVPVANVGGRQVAVAPGTTIGDAVAAVYNTRIGSGGAGYRVGREPRDVDTVYLGSWPRRELAEVGGFSTAVGPNEDTELNVRWRRAGKRVRLLPDLAIGYLPRESLTALARQYARYGYWRTRTIALHGEVGLRQAAALAPVGATGLALTAGRRRPLGRLPLVGYVGVLAVAGVRTRQRPAVRGAVPAVLATMHLSWGAGFVAGLVTLAATREETPARRGGDGPSSAPARPNVGLQAGLGGGVGRAKTTTAVTHLDVLILTRGRPGDLARLLDGVIPQLRDGDRCIVLENGDDAARLARLPERYPSVQWAAEVVNLGVAGGRNALGHLGANPVLLYLDDDAEAAPGLLDGVRAAFDGDAALDVLALRIDDPTTGRPRPHEFPSRDKGLADTPFRPTYFVGAGFALRRRSLDAVGGFDDHLQYALEELDLSFRLLAWGARFAYDPSLRVLHHAAVAERPPGRFFTASVRSRWWVPVRHLPWPAAVSHVVGWTLVLGLRAARAGQLPAWWAGVHQGARQLPAALRIRRPLPPQAVARLRAEGGRLWW